MKLGKILFIFVLSIIIFSSVNGVELNNLKDKINKENYRVIYINKAVAGQKDCMASVDFSFPDEIIIEAGAYPVLIEWNIDYILNVSKKIAYENNITCIAKISKLRTSTAGISHYQKGPYDLSINGLNPISIFFRSDAKKTKNVEIIIKISNSLDNTEEIFTKNIKVRLGRAKIKLEKEPIFENLQSLNFFLKNLLKAYTKY